MTFDQIRLVLYRYFLSATQRGKELTAVCQSIGHGKIEIMIQDGKPVQVNVLGSQRESEEMKAELAKLLAGAGAKVTA